VLETKVLTKLHAILPILILKGVRFDTISDIIVIIQDLRRVNNYYYYYYCLFTYILDTGFDNRSLEDMLINVRILTELKSHQPVLQFCHS